MKALLFVLLIAMCGLHVTLPAWSDGSFADQQSGDVDQASFYARKKPRRDSGSLRVATFNVSLHRKQAGELNRQLETGENIQARRIAEVIQRVRPDVLLLNEIDLDQPGHSVRLFQEKFLEVAQNEQAPLIFPYVYVASVNTGVLSGFDINRDGKISLPDDGFGFGAFPGQYGMALLSKYPIERQKVRTFQKFRWKDMPSARLPQTDFGKPYYPPRTLEGLRLASKSFWDIPVSIGPDTWHFICTHPTPPVFDGPEDRNGCRNHDEIRMIADYVGGKGEYLYDDQGRQGGLAAGVKFVVLGDLNADPNDGDSLPGAVTQLLECPAIDPGSVPESLGAQAAAEQSGQKNLQHQGAHRQDTADFDDRVAGNLRVDYCLPSRQLRVVESGVFWPRQGEPGFELNQASDHHLVWIDVMVQ